MDFPSDIDVIMIHNYLSGLKTSNSYIDKLEKQLPDIFDVKSIVLFNNDVFWTAQLGRNKWQVRPKVNVKFCWQYFDKICDGECGELHLCKQYVQSSCKSPCQYGLSHDLNSSHNKYITKNIFPKSCHQHYKKLQLLHSSFPRLCKSFNEKGSCEKIFCGYLHVCLDMLNGTCPTGSCLQSQKSRLPKGVVHDFRREHNCKVLQNFDLISNYCREEILANIFHVSTAAQLNNPDTAESATSSNEERICSNASSILFSSKCLPDEFTSSLTETSLNKDFPSKLQLELCYNYIQGKCLVASCPRLHMCKEYLISEQKCADICLHGLSHNPFDEHNSRIIGKGNISLPAEVSKILYVLRNSFPTVCKSYLSNTCNTASCGKIHVCIKTLSNTVCISNSCTLSHNIHDTYNREILKAFSLDVNPSRKLNINYLLTNILFTAPNIESEGASKHVTTTDDLAALSPTSGIAYKRFNIWLCDHYLNRSCTDVNCNQLHLCKDYLTDPNSCLEVCKDGYSHDPLDDHNKCALKLTGMDTRNSIMSILRVSFPTVCTNYIEDHLCRQDCDKIHVCPMAVKINGCKDDRCKLSHNIAHSLQKFLLSRNRPSVLPANFAESILIPRSYNKTVASESSTLPIVNKDLKSINKSKSKENSDKLQVKMNDCSIRQKSSQEEPKLTLNNMKRSNNDVKTVQTTELEVFEFILTRSSGSEFTCQLIRENVFKHLDFDTDPIDVNDFVSNWMKQYPSTFRIVKEKLLTYGDCYYLCVESVAPCFDYWLGKCENSHCDKFHICKKFLHDIQHSGISCHFNHTFTQQHNRQLISKNMLEGLSHQDLKLLLKIRYPFVCENYLKGTCDDGEHICQYVHVCGEFLEGKCTKSKGLCNHNHEKCLISQHAVRLMKEFHIKNPEDFKKCIIYWKCDPTENQIQKNFHVKLQGNFNWLVKEAICYEYIEGDCESCNLHHLESGLPYAWQYYHNSMWNMFDGWFNQEIEKAFCDPQKDSFDSRTLDAKRSEYVVIAPSWRRAWFGSNVRIKIRRLSTKSSVLVHDTQAVAMTDWKWYWKKKMGRNQWEEYTNGTTSHSIEKAYLANYKGIYDFTTNEFKYELNFATMQQQNIDERYKTVRDVRRRPTYKTKKTMSRVTQVITVKHALPLHWPIKNTNFNAKGGRIAVNIKTRLKIENSFCASMNHSVRFIDVEEICNAEFFEAYQSKKLALTSKVGSYNLNELSLYHGTDHSVVNGICAQNFDWRLCGKNATAYGQGSYFAKNASYSHSFTTPDAEKFRYMFVANILVGRYTKGNTCMKRPPSVNQSLDEFALYDSCVDNCNDPSIYVIFEKDQCYPQYLITYINHHDVFGYSTQQAIRRKSAKTKLQPINSAVPSNSAQTYVPPSVVTRATKSAATPSPATPSLTTTVPKKDCVIS